MKDVPDAIERSIEIDAPAEIVWELVSEPGWFINDYAIVEHEVRDEGDHQVVVDPKHGEFPVVAEVLEPPRLARFRFLVDGGSTVEFTIADRPGGVTLTVVERGFADYEGNLKSWGIELELARDWCLARA